MHAQFWRQLKADAILRAAGNGSGSYFGDGGAATNASLNLPAGAAVDGSGNLFIADWGNKRIREVHFDRLPTLTLDDVSAANFGNYRVIITSPYGSVTSAVATVTVLLPPVIVMSEPHISVNKLLLGFSLSNSASASFTLLQTPNLTGPWTTNTAAVLTSNAQTERYQFTIPTPNSVESYRVRSP